MRTLKDFLDRNDLITEVIVQIKKDLEDGCYDAIEELLNAVPDDNLIAFLPEFQENEDA